jgi:hypothetical protein
MLFVAYAKKGKQSETIKRILCPMRSQAAHTTSAALSSILIACMKDYILSIQSASLKCVKVLIKNK